MYTYPGGGGSPWSVELVECIGERRSTAGAGTGEASFSSTIEAAAGEGEAGGGVDAAGGAGEGIEGAGAVGGACV